MSRTFATASGFSQAGILDSVPPLARYLTFSVIDAEKVRNAVQSLRQVDGDNVVVGLAESVVECLDANIPGLKPFPALTGAGIDVPATAGALWIWLRGIDRGDLVLESRRLQAQISSAFELTHVVDAFKHDTGRDLTGYEDGTENPEGDAAVAAALVADRGRGLDGSSFVAVQQWQHDFKRFDALTAEEQDNSMGRRRSDNEELDDAPESAHVKRTAQESFSPEAFVLRRSMPWVHEMRAGLMFVAFGHSFDPFEAQMRRMIGADDGIADALFRYTRPITGNFYWCPPMREGQLDLSALGF